MPPVGFEPTISVGERMQTYALDLADTEIGGFIYQFYSNPRYNKFRTDYPIILESKYLCTCYIE
jgi:hypothetical protein